MVEQEQKQKQELDSGLAFSRLGGQQERSALVEKRCLRRLWVKREDDNVNIYNEADKVSKNDKR